MTAAAAAQGLDWAPISVHSLAVVSYSLSQNSSSATALLDLTVSAEVGVSGSLSDVATTSSSSSRRRLLSTSSKQICSKVCTATFMLDSKPCAQMQQFRLQDNSGQAESTLQLPRVAMLSVCWAPQHVLLQVWL